MNKLFTKVAALTLGVAMAAGVGVSLGSAKVSQAKAAEETVSWTATAANNLGSAISAAGGTATGTILTGSYTWNYTRTLVSLADNKNDNISFQGETWIQMGSNNALESIELTTSAIPGTIKAVSVVAAAAGGNHKLTVDVGGTKYLNNADLVSYSGTASASNPNPTDCVVTANNQSSSGTITITIANPGTTKKAFLLRSISVTYDEGGTPGTSYSVTDNVEHGSVSPSSVSEGATLTATITPDSGYVVPESVAVTMGGQAAAGATYSNGVVTLSNVTGAVVISGTCPEKTPAVEPEVVETTLDGFVKAQDAQYSLAYHFSAEVEAFKSGEQKDKYGNMTLTDGSNHLTVYGSTVTASALAFNSDSGLYEFTNPTDFITNATSNAICVGDTVEVKFIRYLFNSKLQGQGIILSVTPGEHPEIPEPDLVETTFAEFISSSDDDYKKLYHFNAEIKAFKEGETKDQWGNMTLTDGENDLVVYGSTATSSSVAWGSISGSYSFSNPKDFTTNEFTNGLAVGDTIEVKFLRYHHNNVLQGTGIIVSKVTPAKTLVSIAVTHQPTKTVYEIGDQLSTEGLVVTATYSDESTATIESGLAFSGFDSSSAGQKTVTVTYEGKSATFNVTVNAPAPVLTGIEVTVPPTKLSYAVGEELDTTGLVVTATYSVGDPQVVSQGLTFTGYNKDQVGQQTVVVHYEDQTAEFTVTVSEPVVVGIEVTQLPTKVEYGYGEQFDPSGIEVTASYSVGEPKVVTEGLEYSGFDSEEVGSQTITVSYQGETAEFEVSVVIKDWLPEQKEAFIEHVGKELPFLGEAFVYSLQYDGDEGYFGGYAEGSYVNAIKSACSSWDYYYYDEAQEVHYITDPNGDGRAVLCFYEYMGYTLIQYWAEDVDHVLVTDGDFDYYVGDSLDVSSLAVYVVDKTETKGSPVPASQCSFSVTNFTEAGLVDIEIKYAYYYGTFQVLVSPVVATSLSLDVSKAIKTFKVGDGFDPTGVVSTLHFNNGSTQDVSDQVEFSGFDSSSVGEKTITVTYGDFEAEYVVNVVPAYDADSFGEEFLARISKICNGYDGRTNNKDALRTVWKTMEQKYLLSLSDAEKLRVINAKADENGSNLEKAMAFYDYACKKYRLDKFIENRVINAQVLEPETTNNNIPVIIAVVSAIAGITLIGVIIAYRRRRSLYIK